MTDAITLGGFAVPFRNSYNAGDAVTQPFIYDATGSQVGSVRGPWPDPETAKLAAVLAEAPAMLAALHKVTAALAEIDDYPLACGLSPDVQNSALNDAFTILARIEGTPTAQPAAPSGGIDPVSDFAAHSAAIEAAQGYASDPAMHNPPSPAQVAHLLALSGISHGPIGTDQDGEG